VGCQNLKHPPQNGAGCPRYSLECSNQCVCVHFCILFVYNTLVAGLESETVAPPTLRKVPGTGQLRCRHIDVFPSTAIPGEESVKRVSNATGRRSCARLQSGCAKLRHEGIAETSKGNHLCAWSGS
jgi:hypothetical protein